MKKMTLIFLLISFVLGKSFAQDFAPAVSDPKTNEVYLSVGTSSFLGLFSGVFASIFKSIAESSNKDGNKDGNESNKSNDEPAFSIAAGYNHFFWDHLGVGGFINFESTLGINLFAVQAKLSGQYGFTRFKAYHALSGGVIVAPGGDLSTIFDVTLLGLKLDFDDFNIFVEGCLPSTALLKIGGAYKF